MPSKTLIEGRPHEPTHEAPAKSAAGLRTDIQALRALAVLAVLVFHFAPDRLPGGFAGVDIFFVISGFLITGNLLREAQRDGRVNLRNFWAKRARRLFPAATAVLLTSAVVTLVAVPASLQRQFLEQIVASALYVQNWVLAGQSVDYLAANAVASPVQHFWTLSVEEQFYVFVPLLLAAACLVSRRLSLDLRRAIFVSLAVLTGASFVHCLYLTGVSQPSAYFVTTTRAWEFGVGGLLAFSVGARSRRWGAASVVVGLLVLLATVLSLSSTSAFPGYLALLPVLGTAALIWGGGNPGTALAAVLAWRPAQVLGHLSYAVYLWHWSILALTPYVTGRELTRNDKLAAIALTFLLAWLSTRFLEDPVRHYAGRSRTSRTFPRSTAKLTVACFAAMLLVVGVGGVGIAANNRAIRQEETKLADALKDNARCLGAATVFDSNCVDDAPLGDLLTPAAARVHRDGLFRPECTTEQADTTLHLCSFGPVDATVRMAAVGDSHNAMLVPAYKALAERNGWRVDVASHFGCAWVDGVQDRPVAASVAGCEGWKTNLTRHLAEQRPYDAVLVTQARGGAPLRRPPGTDATDAMVAGLRSIWAPLAARGSRIIVLRDNPLMKPSTAACVDQYRSAAAAHCSRSRFEALGKRDAQMEAAARTPEAATIDLTDIYCAGGRCSPVIGSVVVYRDKDHLTATFVNTLIPVLEQRIRVVLARQLS